MYQYTKDHKEMHKKCQAEANIYPEWSFDMNYLYVCTALAILSKLISIVCIDKALSNYIKQKENYVYILTGIVACVAPTCLVAPLFAFDNLKCEPRNLFYSSNL